MYYKIKEATGSNETGTSFPQSQEMSKGYDYDSNKSILNVANYRGIKIPVDIDFGVLKLASQAKFSDVISSSMLGGMGLIISQKLKSIFESLCIVEHEFYPLKIEKKGIVNYEYVWLHIISDLREHIDFSRSVFFTGLAKGKEYISFQSIDEYYKYDREIDKFGMLRATKLFFKDSYENQFDLFCISGFDKNIYVSEKLLILMRENDVTGYKADASTILLPNI